MLPWLKSHGSIQHVNRKANVTNYIDNLNDHNMQCIMITAGVPSDDRVVHVYDIQLQTNKPMCASARYKQGRWFGVMTGDDISDSFTPKACWGESIFSTPESIGTFDNRIDESNIILRTDTAYESIQQLKDKLDNFMLEYGNYVNRLEIIGTPPTEVLHEAVDDLVGCSHDIKITMDKLKKLLLDKVQYFDSIPFDPDNYIT